MITDKVLKNNNVKLRIIGLSDCNENYLNWLNDYETNLYMDTRWIPQTLDSIRQFVSTVTESTNNYLFAVEYENKHVGNIKLGHIDYIHKFADVSYFIGDKSVRGKGVASIAVNLVCGFAFEDVHLNKTIAGTYPQNIASQKVLERNGFKLEGVQKSQYFIDDKEILPNGEHKRIYTDCFLYGLLAKEYKKIGE